MKTNEERAFVAKTLAWCNARRKTKGKKPLSKLPKGKRFDGTSCPCGTATGLFVGRQRYCANNFTLDEHRGRRLPESVTQFVIALDTGALPQYTIDDN